MTISRIDAIDGLRSETQAFAQLIGGLDDESWNAPTRCEGWSVADVSAHVIGTFADLAAGRFEGLGTEEVTAREVTERKGRSPSDLVGELDEVMPPVMMLAEMFDDESWLAPAPGGYDGNVGQAVEALYYDTYLHGDDIRVALGLESASGPGLRASVHHVASELEKRDFGPAVFAFDDVEEVQIGDGGPRYEGPALPFVLAVTGRGDPQAFGLDESTNLYA
jgi:uncharacterized protein (TIGR03083 family)